MATKKTETKRKPKNETVTYKEQKYEVMERQPDRIKLTDGRIHFWVKAKDVKA